MRRAVGLAGAAAQRLAARRPPPPRSASVAERASTPDGRRRLPGSSRSFAWRNASRSWPTSRNAGLDPREDLRDARLDDVPDGESAGASSSTRSSTVTPSSRSAVHVRPPARLTSSSLDNRHRPPDRRASGSPADRPTGTARSSRTRRIVLRRLAVHDRQHVVGPYRRAFAPPAPSAMRNDDAVGRRRRRAANRASGNVRSSRSSRATADMRLPRANVSRALGRRQPSGSRESSARRAPTPRAPGASPSISRSADTAARGAARR